MAGFNFVPWADSLLANLPSRPGAVEPGAREAVAGVGSEGVQPARGGRGPLQRHWPRALSADPRRLQPAHQSLQRGSALRPPQLPQAE
ncbi:hypothetical protein CEXT_368841 [Caerostris extrusa]|uniref:Uncharacterized protein n=1 Tax=Caerostris extrusa TaxID=172846 RepID=A0AAV4Q5T8_CAEEX|nr:hypothetical protein CEXT_368841 [Caerostris extrusa]